VIDLSQITALFKDWSGVRHILAAVSGGPDSVALLHMLAQWQQGGLDQNRTEPGRDHPRISCATVDHGLRRDARDEAAAVQHFARSLGIEHHIVTWEHDGLVTGLQERARDARYALLLRRAKQTGADVIMTAHHADDQAETILFRLTRGSGLHGLTGMARQRTLDSTAERTEEGFVMLARPLLEVRKQDLIAYCQTHAIAFVNDPTNSNKKFARSRMRKLLPELEKEGLGPKEWSRFARRMRRADEALAAAAGAALNRHGSGDPANGLAINFAALVREPDEIILRVLITAVGRFDSSKPVPLERAEALAQKLGQACRTGKIHTSTLGHAKISLNAKGILTLHRQSARTRGFGRSRPC
jgi:tRNA(Ile)-lysidine synthase